MTEPSVSFAGNLTDDPELRHTEAGIARAIFRVAVSGRREQEASFFTVIVWRDQAEHAAQSLAKGSRVVVVGRLQQRAWDRRGRQRPIHRRGHRRGAGAKPALGNGHDDQDHAEPVASATDATVRDAKHGVPLRRVRAGEVRREEFLYELKAGSAGRPPAAAACGRQALARRATPIRPTPGP